MQNCSAGVQNSNVGGQNCSAGVQNSSVSVQNSIVGSSSSSSSSLTDRWVHFQQNAGLRLIVRPCIVHDIDNCYLITWTFGGFSTQCVSKFFFERVHCSVA